MFSKGRILLSHLRSRLSVQSTRAVLCVGAWSSLGYVSNGDIKVAAELPDVDGREEKLDNDWDVIQ